MRSWPVGVAENLQVTKVAVHMVVKVRKGTADRIKLFNSYQMEKQFGQQDCFYEVKFMLLQPRSGTYLMSLYVICDANC